MPGLSLVDAVDLGARQPVPEPDLPETDEDHQPEGFVARDDDGRTTTGEIECDLRQLVTVGAIPPESSSDVSSAPSVAPSSSRSSHRFARRVVALAVLGAAAAVVVAIPRSAPPPSPPQAHPPQNRPQLAVSVFPAAAGLDCRLAISALSDDHTTGFIVFGGGRAQFRSVQTSGTTYVPALDRWVDVLPQMVAPDGRSYVTAEGTRGNVTIDVVGTSGTRRFPAPGADAGPFAFTPDGILLLDTPGPPSEADTLKLELMDPVSGEVRSLPHPGPRYVQADVVGASSSAGYLRSGNSLWLTAYDPHTDSTSVRSYGLDTGVTTDWFEGPPDGHGYIEVVGTTADGLPILQLSDPDLFHSNPAQRDGIAVQTMLLTSPHHATVLNHGAVGDAGIAGSLSPLSVTQGDEVWLASDDGGIWLYRPSAGLQQVAKVRTGTRGAPGVAISGPCA
jgi:hypothetical protein